MLLQKLVTDYGGGRLRDVARLLWEYCERGTPWIARPGLAEAQQLTALNFIEPRRAQAWLERAETEKGRGGAIADERWFVAMRRDWLAGQQPLRGAGRSRDARWFATGAGRAS